MLSFALHSGELTDKQARQTFGEQVLALAQRTKDPEMYNAAARLYVGTDRLMEIDRAGWDATHDPRFAASLLSSLLAKDQLTIDDPRLAKALKEFPEDAYIAGMAVALAKKDGKPLKPYVVNAIKAEYSKFSSGGLLGAVSSSPWPKAHRLRVYFQMLEKLQSHS